ncbi:hypothetical protein NL676_004352 [Syzygium grande]|nr:hypothetical protein NL676_004352 [Syzygium grande]
MPRAAMDQAPMAESQGMVVVFGRIGIGRLWKSVDTTGLGKGRGLVLVLVLARVKLETSSVFTAGGKPSSKGKADGEEGRDDGDVDVVDVLDTWPEFWVVRDGEDVGVDGGVRVKEREVRGSDQQSEEEPVKKRYLF